MFLVVSDNFFFYNTLEHSFCPGRKERLPLMKEEYVSHIIESLYKCEDLALLDLISQLLDSAI